MIVHVCSTDTKSTLGKIFGNVMDIERQHIGLDTLVSLLSETISSVVSTMRDHIITICRVLSTSFNFLIPDKLSEFLFSIEYIDTAGMVVIRSSTVKSSWKKPPTSVYASLSAKTILSPSYKKCIRKHKGETSLKVLGAIRCSMISGQISEDGEYDRI